MAEEVLKITADNSEFINGLKEAQNANQQFSDSVKKNSDDMAGHLTAQLKIVEKNLADVTRAMSSGADKGMRAGLEFAKVALEKQREELIKLGAQQEKTAKSIEKQTTVTKLQAKTVNSLRQELLRAKYALAEMDLAGQGGSKSYVELSKRAGVLAAAIDAATKSVNNFGSATKHINGVVEGVQGAIGAFAAFQGVLALTGDESEEMEATMKRMQSLLTIMIGLQQVQNLLQKESAFVQLLMTAREKILAVFRKKATADIAVNTAATKANTVAMGENAAASTASAAAMEEGGDAALKAGKSASGSLGAWGLLLAAIVAIIYATEKFVKWAYSAADATDKLRTSLDQSANSILFHSKNINTTLGDLESYYTELKNFGKTDAELTQQKIDLINKEAAASQQQFKDNIAQIDDAILKTEQYIASQEAKQKSESAGLSAGREMKAVNFTANTDLTRQNKLLEQLKKWRDDNNNSLRGAVDWQKKFNAEMVIAIKQAEAEVEAEKRRQEALEKRKRALDEYLRKLKELSDESRKSDIEQLTGFARVQAEGQLALDQIQLFADELLKIGREAFGKEFQLTAESVALIEGLRINARKQTNAEIKKLNDEYIKNAEATVDAIRAVELKRFSFEQDLAADQFEADQRTAEAAFNLVYHTEKEKNDFQKEQARLRYEFEITQAQAQIKLYEDIAASTGQVFDDEIAKLQIRIQNARANIQGLSAVEGDGSLLSLMGMTPEDISMFQSGVDAFDQATNQILGILANRYAQEVAYYQGIVQARETALSEAERQLDQEIELAKLGYANNVQLRQKEIEDLKRQRAEALRDQEAAQKKQEQINLLQQASGLVTAVANIFTTYSEIPYVGVILAAIAAAAMLVDFLSIKSQVKSATSTLAEGGTGIVKGKRHSQGGEPFEKHIEVEDGERWGIWSRGASSKYGDAIPELVNSLNHDQPLRAMAALSRFVPINPNMQVLKDIERTNNISINDYATMESKLDELKGEVADLNKYFKTKQEIIETGKDYIKVKQGNTIRTIKNG